MLTARKASVWRSRYEITVDGRMVAVWDGSMWKSSGTFELDGVPHRVSGNAWGTRFSMVTGDGATVATAERVGRKRWSVEAGGQTYAFRRRSWSSSEQELLVGDLPVGSIRRTSVWRGDATADLPGLPLPVQIFVVAVVIKMWESEAAVAAS